MRASGIAARETADKIYAVGHFANSPPSTLTAGNTPCMSQATFSDNALLFIATRARRGVVTSCTDRNERFWLQTDKEKQNSFIDLCRSQAPDIAICAEQTPRWLLSSLRPVVAHTTHLRRANNVRNGSPFAADVPRCDRKNRIRVLIWTSRCYAFIISLKRHVYEGLTLRIFFFRKTVKNN